ncbi:MAG: YebC/PmpR family DNA-binding transcriptional regulator [Candidatus Riflebacteria bacterium]|nr:YebC/PmpR family DNA-binding transcriptional regulator [Candidatus Riflebacteria bacterium]
MSGHSKWATIKHKKAATDAKRGKVFTKLIRELTVAARMGGGDETMNPRLRTIVVKAKAINMPSDTIRKAIMRGTGELEGVHYEEKHYEGYGPGGVAILIEALTDNANRTSGEMRFVLSRNGGRMAEPGAVAYMFKTKGVLTFSDEAVSEDLLMEKLLDAGVDDIAHTDASTFEVTCDSSAFNAVKAAADAAGLKYESAEVTKVPTNTVRLEGADAQKMLKLVEALEDHDDVQNVFANFDIPMSEMEAASA